MPGARGQGTLSGRNGTYPGFTIQYDDVFILSLAKTTIACKYFIVCDDCKNLSWSFNSSHKMNFLASYIKYYQRNIRIENNKAFK